MRVDGSPVGAEAREVWAVNKPAGVVSTAREPGERPAVVELVDSAARLYPVGRLDADSTGLLLLTNDGELANRLTHPRYEVPRPTGRGCGGRPPTATCERLRRGVELEDGPTAPAEVTPDRRARDRDRPARGAQPPGPPDGRGGRQPGAWRCAGSASARWRSAGWPSGGSRRLAEEEIARLWKDAELVSARAGPTRPPAAPLRRARRRPGRGQRGRGDPRRDRGADAGADRAQRRSSRRRWSAACSRPPTTSTPSSRPSPRAGLGLDAVPLLCCREIPVPGSMPRVIRVMLHFYAPAGPRARRTSTSARRRSCAPTSKPPSSDPARRPSQSAAMTVTFAEKLARMPGYQAGVPTGQAPEAIAAGEHRPARLQRVAVPAAPEGGRGDRRGRRRR